MDLKPCPFCGSAPNATVQNDDQEIPLNCKIKGRPRYYQTVWCENCGAEGGKRVTPEKAVSAWNTRAPSHPGAQGKDALREAVAEVLAAAVFKDGHCIAYAGDDYVWALERLHRSLAASASGAGGGEEEWARLRMLDILNLGAALGLAQQALEPFAAVADEIGARGKDDECWCGQNGAVIRYGDLRRAKSVALTAASTQGHGAGGADARDA